MDVTLASWFVILLALFGANLPFLNERLFGVLSLSSHRKSFWLRLLEMACLYVIVGAIARLLENRSGNAFVQGWEFHAVTVCLFIVAAYPGFVLRYLRQRRKV